MFSWAFLSCAHKSWGKSRSWFMGFYKFSFFPRNCGVERKKALFLNRTVFRKKILQISFFCLVGGSFSRLFCRQKIFESESEKRISARKDFFLLENLTPDPPRLFLTILCRSFVQLFLHASHANLMHGMQFWCMVCNSVAWHACKLHFMHAWNDEN